jgi:hypothetical protein
VGAENRVTPCDLHVFVDEACGAENPVASCDLHVFVDEAAEPVSS